MGIIPVVNENDTVSYDEIEIGDNDNLSAVVADLVDADLLVLFSDIDGLYDDDPHKNKTQNYFLQYTILTKSEMLQAVREQAEVRAVW